MGKIEAINKILDELRVHPITKGFSEAKLLDMAKGIYQSRMAKAARKYFLERAKNPDEELKLFPTREEALKIAQSNLGEKSRIIQVTDNPRKLTNGYNIPPGCWYIIYTENESAFILKSSLYMAISKVDGRVIVQESLNDEG